MMIKVGDRFHSNGKHGTVIATNRNYPNYPVVFLRDDGVLGTFTSEGWFSTCGEHPKDLKPIVEEYWINVSQWNNKTVTSAYPTKEQADECACKRRIACVKVMEGEYHGN